MKMSSGGEEKEVAPPRMRARNPPIDPKFVMKKATEQLRRDNNHFPYCTLDTVNKDRHRPHNHAIRPHRSRQERSVELDEGRVRTPPESRERGPG
jgi:hypothetical protein